MIDITDKINFPSGNGIRRFNIETHECVRQFTKEVMDECLNQRFHDPSGRPFYLDFEVGRIYDVLIDWTTLNDDGYLWATVLKDRYCGHRTIHESEILVRIYSTVLISCFRKLGLDEIRNLKILDIIDRDVP